MSWHTEAEREFWRRRCYDSFWWFFKYCYGYDFNPKGALGHRPWLAEGTHKQACDWFQKHALEWLEDRKQGKARAKKLICVVPRDWGKTTLFAQAGQIWLHLHDPELATYTGCETITRAREVLNGIKAVITGDDPYSRYTWLYGRQGPSPRRKWKVDGVVTAARTNLTRRDDSYGIWAVQSGMVGLHPDGGFFDDPNTYERMDRHSDWLDNVWNHMSTLIPVFQIDAFWMLTATRYGDGDHIGRSVQRGGVRSMEGMPMPGVSVEGTEGIWDVFYLDAIDEKTNTLVMPQIWDWTRIKTFERENSVRYWAQVRNNPTQNPYNTLPRSVADRLYIDPEKVDFKRLRVSLHLDTAFKNPRRRTRGDDNVISGCGHEQKTGRVIFLGAKVNKDWDSDEFCKALIEQVKYWRAKALRISCITDEQDIGGKPGVWPALLKTKFREAKVEMPELLVLDRDNKRKEDYLIQAAGFWRDGKMALLRNAENVDKLVDQMTKIGMSEFNDVADATKDCFNKQVYQIVWAAKAGTADPAAANPFDEVLKPGPRGEEAAEKIAAMYALQEANYSGHRFDVIQMEAEDVLY
jgi:hypothetical protein